MSNGKEFDLWVSSKAPMDEFGNMPKSIKKLKTIVT